MKRLLPVGLLVAAALGACKKPPPPGPTPAAGASVAAASSSATVAERRKPGRLTGSALARSADDRAIYLADEDASVLRRLPIDFAAGEQGSSTPLPGPPAQVIARDGEVWVTVRDPGQILVFSEQPDGSLHQQASIALPADAWGMALSPDESTLIVTSAWAHTVSVVDVASRAVVAKLDVPREPRGATFTLDGKHAYVSHLVGTALTRVDLAGASSTTHAVPLPAGTHRAPRRFEPSASLGYAPVLSPDGKRLLVPRHALGTVSPPGPPGWNPPNAAWWGTASVDVLLTADETPLMPPRAFVPMVGRFDAAEGLPKRPTDAQAGVLPAGITDAFIQPVDALYRARTSTLLVVSQGTDGVSELDARALDPALGSNGGYGFAAGYLTGKNKTPFAETGAAPQAIAMTADELEIFIWARGTREIARMPMSGAGGTPAKDQPVIAGPFPDPQPKDVAAGRKLFFLAKDPVMSGGLACAGCHPDGRDDGFTYHEAKGAIDAPDTGPVFVGHPQALLQPNDRGVPRRTPILAGRVAAKGPYGWHAQDADLEARLLDGFALHRWSHLGFSTPSAYEKANRMRQLAAYVRQGLRPPPRDASPLTELEQRGKSIFESDRAACRSCHPGESEFTTRAAVPLRAPLPVRDGFEKENDQAFKVPSLLFVGGHAPYFHDGSMATLTELVEKNGNRMGDTSGLSADERRALVAYLERL